MMCRRVDWVSITREYLAELYEEIRVLSAENEELEDQIATLLSELAAARMSRMAMPPVPARRAA